MKDKLKSQEGASILVALLFFLLCAIIGGIILTAASVSSGKMNGLKSQEQSYYTLSSAANLLRDEIEGQTYSRYVVFTDQAAETPFEQDGQQVTGYNAEPDGAFADILLAAADSVSAGSPEAPSTLNITSENSKFEDVTARWEMDEDYNITVTLSSVGELGISYTLTIPAAISQAGEVSQAVTDDGTTCYRKTTTLMWTDGVIRKDR